MGVLAKKKIYPTSNEENEQSNDGQRTNAQQIIRNQLHNRVVSKQDSQLDESQFNQRKRTFIIRQAFETGLNQLSSTIKKPVNHKRLTKLDSNNVELIQGTYRRNGWSPPLHPLQIAAFFVLILMAGLLFIYFLPMISLEDVRFVYLIYALCILITIVHLILHTIAISINPADDNVIAKQRNQPNRQPPIFDRNQNKHVIDSNQFCYICEVHVGNRSKHCSRCNVCVSDFDHHCHWLNTCISSKNYKLFISTIISALVGTSLILGLSILFVVCWLNSNCVWLDNVYLNGLNFEEETDNQTNVYDDTLNTTIVSLISNSSTSLQVAKDSLDSFMTTINSTFDNDYSNDNFTDHSFNSTDEEDTSDGTPLHYQTIVHLSIIFTSLLLSSTAVILLLHLLCFHLFLNCIGLSTYEFIIQRREAAKQGDDHQPTFNERILRCLSCQSDFCANLLPKSQTELATSQSIIEKSSNHSNLAKKRQLTQQMSNESRMSKNSGFSRESERYSSRTVSIYEDFVGDEMAANKMMQSEAESSQCPVYTGSPHKQQKRVLEEHDLLKTLNNRSLASDHETNNPTYQPPRFDTPLNSYSSEPSRTIDKLVSANELAVLDANNLLIKSRLEKRPNDSTAMDEDRHSNDHKMNEEADRPSANRGINPEYLDNLSEYKQPVDCETNRSNEPPIENSTHIRFQNIDD